MTPPNIPWLDEGLPPITEPMLTPCPEGWHEAPPTDGGHGVVTCHPYAAESGERRPDECAHGWTHFVGDRGCAPVGDPCPAGDFPEGLPSAVPLIYVLASAPAGGDGSQGAPFATLLEAMRAASSGTVVAIGKGVYDGPVRPSGGVTLWGACAAETQLTASSPGRFDEAVVTAHEADTHLKNLSIGPALLPGLVASGPEASVSVDGLLIEETTGFGLIVLAGARVYGREFVVLDTRSNAAGRFGRGIEVEGAGVVELTRAVLSRNREIGIFAMGEDTSMTLSDVLIEDTEGQESDRTGGRGLGAQSGAMLVVSRALLLGNQELGAFANGPGTLLALSDVLVLGTEGQESDHTGGRGLSVQDGATATVSRARFSHNRELGVYVSHEDTSVTLSDVVVEDTREQQSDGAGGRGIGIQGGATVVVSRAFVLRNRDTGVYLRDEGTAAMLSDIVVGYTREQESDRLGGRGINVQGGATLELTRAQLTHNRELSLYVGGEGTSATLFDLAVEDTQTRESNGTGGRGLGVEVGATVTVTRAVLSRSGEVGVFVGGPRTSVSLSDVVIRDTLGGETGRSHGRGLSVQLGATATVSHAVLARNREFAVAALGSGVAIRLSDTVVTQTSAQSCEGTSCTDDPGGVGLVAASGGSLMGTRFEVSDSALCGVLLADEGQLSLSVGIVTRSLVGVCLQIDGYPVERLTDRVRFLDNGTNLDTTGLPLPEPLEAAPSMGSGP